MSVTIRILIQGTGESAAGMHLPDDVVEALGKGKKPPVKATINGYTWRSTVAVMGGARARPGPALPAPSTRAKLCGCLG